MAYEEFEVANSEDVRVVLDKQTDEVHVIFPKYLLNKPRKPLAESEVGHTGTYRIAASETFVYAVKKLPAAEQPNDYVGNSFRCQITIGRKVSQVKRKALFDRCIAAGRKMSADCMDEFDPEQGGPAYAVKKQRRQAEGVEKFEVIG